MESYGRVSCLLALPVMTTIAAAARQGAAYVLGVPHHSLFAAPTDADVANVHAPTRMQMFHHPTGCDGHSTCHNFFYVLLLGVSLLIVLLLFVFFLLLEFLVQNAGRSMSACLRSHSSFILIKRGELRPSVRPVS